MQWERLRGRLECERRAARGSGRCAIARPMRAVRACQTSAASEARGEMSSLSSVDGRAIRSSAELGHRGCRLCKRDAAHTTHCEGGVDDHLGCRQCPICGRLSTPAAPAPPRCRHRAARCPADWRLNQRAPSQKRHANAPPTARRKARGQLISTGYRVAKSRAGRWTLAQPTALQP